MKPINIKAVMKDKPKFVSPDGKASFWIGDAFNGGMIGVAKFSGQSPWERHPEADELIHNLEGEVEIILLKEKLPTKVTVSEGSVFIVPKGIWHRQSSEKGVIQFGATSGKTEHSMEEDPRRS